MRFAKRTDSGTLQKPSGVAGEWARGIRKRGSRPAGWLRLRVPLERPTEPTAPQREVAHGKTRRLIEITQVPAGSAGRSAQEIGRRTRRSPACPGYQRDRGF